MLTTHTRPDCGVDVFGWYAEQLGLRQQDPLCTLRCPQQPWHRPDEFTAPRRERASIQEALAPTVEAITKAGLPFHEELWLSDTGRCTQCHDGCTTCGQEDQP